MSGKTEIFKLLIAGLLITAAPCFVFSNVYTVGASGCDYTTLYDAQNAASDGDTVDVRSNIDESVAWFKAVNITSSQQGVIWTSSQAGATLNVSGTAIGSAPWKISNITIDHSGPDGHTINFEISMTQHLTISNCTLMRSSTGTAENAVLYNTTAFDNYTVTIEKCRIKGNAYSYGIYLTEGNMIPAYDIKNSVFSGFSGSAYAAIRDNAGSYRLNIALMNCDVVNNYNGFSKTGVSVNDGTKFVNTIFANNIVDAKSITSTPINLDFQYDAFGATGSGMGTGCRYSIDPAVEFVNAAAGNYHASAASTNVRNAGTSSGAPAYDYDNVPRPQEGVYDIGMYEYNDFTPTFTPTPTYTVTQTSSATPTITGTYTSTLTATKTYTVTPTYTVTATSSVTRTVTKTNTPTVTYTGTYTTTPTYTVTATSSVTQTATGTNTPTVTYTGTYTTTPTYTVTATSSVTQTATGTNTPTVTYTGTYTTTPTYTVTETSSATETVTDTNTPTVTYTGTYTTTPTYTVTETSSATETVTDTNTPTVTYTGTYTTTPTYTVTETSSATETVTDTNTPTVTYTGTYTTTPTYTVTETSSATETVTDTNTPTVTYTGTYTFTVTATCTITPNETETAQAVLTQIASGWTPTATATPYVTATATVQGDKTIIIYPNPNEGGPSTVLYPLIPGKTISKVTVILNAIDGQKSAQYAEASIFNGKIIMNLSNFANGVYFVRLTVNYTDGTNLRMKMGRLIINRR
jgi:hypothetical protein